MTAAVVRVRAFPGGFEARAPLLNEKLRSFFNLTLTVFSVKTTDNFSLDLEKYSDAIEIPIPRWPCLLLDVVCDCRPW